MQFKSGARTYSFNLTRFLFLIFILIAVALGKNTEQTGYKILSPTSQPETKLKTASESSQIFKVIRVIDGDTIEIEGGQKVRYIGINTPETVDPHKSVQCYGRQASDENKKLVLNQMVKLEKDISETDKYGRLLRYVYVNNQMVNEILVKEGFAYATPYPPDIKFQTSLEQAQKSAQLENKGLWSACKN